MDPTLPPEYENERRGSSGALIAGLLTATVIGGMGGLYYWISDQRSKSEGGAASEVGIKAAPTVVIGSENSEVEVEPSEEEVVSGEAPTAIVKQVVRSLLGRDDWAVDTLLGKALTVQERRFLVSRIGQGKMVVDPSQPVTDLGPTSEGERWAVNLRAPEATSSERLLLEFTQKDGKWVVSSAKLPESLVAAMPANEAAAGGAEALATRFVQTLLAGEYGKLKAMVDANEVTEERIAALGIIFDEAKFQLKPGPGAMRTTNVAEDRAWVVTKVYSPNYQLDSEFGLELKKSGEDWLIDRVNLSNLMSGFSTLAQDEDTFNSPLVNTPNGGDSLVLYFGYDDDKLTARSLKQLAVVASLLKESDGKRIQIGGHADALGDDGYNDSLSQRRASRVADTLRSFGVRKSQIKMEAFGERLPLSPNLNPDGSDNPEGRGRNRRAEIYLDF